MRQPRLTKVEPMDHMRLRLSYETGEVEEAREIAEAEASGFVDEADIDWDNLGKMVL